MAQRQTNRLELTQTKDATKTVKRKGWMASRIEGENDLENTFMHMRALHYDKDDTREQWESMMFSKTDTRLMDIYIGGK